MKHILRRYFGFTNCEANGLILLVLLILAITIGMYAYQWYSYRQISRLYTTADIQKLKEVYNLLTHQLSTDFQGKKKLFSQTTKNKPVKSIIPNRKFFNINIVNAQQLQKIRGIGPVLSQRIVKYRNQLGGFIHKQQYEEIYGLSSEVCKQMKVHTFIDIKKNSPRKININTASIKILLKHPYINLHCAKNIVQYRKEHGLFKNIEALKKVYHANDDWIKKIHPYLTFDE